MEEPQGSTEDTGTTTKTYAVPPGDSKTAEEEKTIIKK